MSLTNIIDLADVKDAKVVLTSQCAVVFKSQSKGGATYFLCPNCLTSKGRHAILQPNHKGGQPALLCHRCGSVFIGSVAIDKQEAPAPESDFEAESEADVIEVNEGAKTPYEMMFTPPDKGGEHGNR